jgi:hypothetical protein
VGDDVGKPIDCPDCGGPLREVALKTPKHILRYELARELQPGRFFYCHNPDCDTVYLRLSDRASLPEETFRRADLKERVRAFETGRDRLVCHCFGYTAGEIEDDAVGQNRIPAALARDVKAGLCACEVMNPKGG